MSTEETHSIYIDLPQLTNLGNYGNVNAKDSTGRAWNLVWDKPYEIRGTYQGPPDFPGPWPPGPTPEGSPVPISVRNWNALCGAECKGCPPTNFKTIVYIKNPPNSPIIIYIQGPEQDMEKAKFVY